MSESAATRNACKLCAPLGACFVFRGIEGAVPFLHGSQGCATYIRRYMISHFKEPVDIASSNFAEASAVFGGSDNLRTGLANVIRQYQPQLVGVATTCLAETIGEDVRGMLGEFRRTRAIAAEPRIVPVSTPSYNGTHIAGFHAAVRAVVETLADGGPMVDRINLFPNMVSPADIRYLREIFADYDLQPTILPDYSETLDGKTWAEYQLIPDGGTPIPALEDMGRARATVELGSTWDAGRTGGAFLAERFGVPRHALALPIGVRLTDALLAQLGVLSGREMPAAHATERGRLVDALIDAHKHVFGVRAVVYGEQDLVVGLTSFLAEIGVVPVLCASGDRTGRFAEWIGRVTGDLEVAPRVLEGADFMEIEAAARELRPDLIIGHSKGYSLARRLDIPLVRVGFPVHDRIGGARILHLGYRGAQQLFDTIVNELIEARQRTSPVGYTYM